MHLKTLIAFLISLSVFQCCYAQKFSISGKVVDAIAAAPLSKASVYINNSTKGTVTDENGFFVFSELAPGTYEIVISYVGYKTKLLSVKLSPNNYSGEFRMELKQKELREVLILSAAARAKYMQIFRKNLLGITADADKCVIKNPEVIQFILAKEKNDLKAYADEELIIENPVLGYTINYEITDFYFNIKTGVTFFSGYIKFTDWIKEKGENKKWIKRRKEVYAGSSQHFFKSLVNRQLKKEGYTIYGLKADKNDGRNDNNLSINTYGDNTTVSTIKFSSGNETISYTEDSLLKQTVSEGGMVYEMLLHGQLLINFQKNSDLKYQLLSRNEPLGQPANGTTSGLRIKKQPVLIDYRGILLTPMNVYFDGIWVYERLANMLPEDYEVRR
jgi:CarboxypepD_reg-like domain